MDILQVNKNKKIIRTVVWLLRKKLGDCATENAIHNDLQNSGNSLTQFLSSLLDYSGKQIKEPYQAKTVKELGELSLWILTKDTAYRDIFFWILDQVLQRADIIRNWIKPYVKEPKDWYVNTWHHTKKRSAKLRAEGKIPKYGKSAEEKIFTPTEQKKVLKR